jgi:hypothetical protein
MIEANPTPKHHFDHKPIGFHRCTKPSKHSLFQQPASETAAACRKLCGVIRFFSKAGETFTAAATY